MLDHIAVDALLRQHLFRLCHVILSVPGLHVRHIELRRCVVVIGCQTVMLDQPPGRHAHDQIVVDIAQTGAVDPHRRCRHAHPKRSGELLVDPLVGRRTAVVVLVRDDECRLFHAAEPPCRRLHHHDAAQGHLHAPPPERLPYLVAQLPAVNEKQHQLSVFRGASGDLRHNDRFSAAAGQHNAGCFVSRPPGLACPPHQIFLICPQYAHNHSSPSSFFLIAAPL